MFFRPIHAVCGSAALSLMLVGLAVPTASAASKCATMTAPVYQALNPSKKTNYLTTSSAAAKKIKTYGFVVDSGAVFKGAPKAKSGLVAVYRLHLAGDFIYTRNKTEAAAAVKRGYYNQGAALFALAKSSSCAVPVYRYLLGGKHRTAVSTKDRNALIAAGATSQGIAFYAKQYATSATPGATAPGTPPATPPAPGSTSADRFSIAVYPDTQQEVLSRTDTRYLERAQYLVSHRSELDLRFLASTGDNANWDTPSHDQYRVLDAGVRPIEAAGIPYSLAIGNHDSNATAVGGSARPGLNIHDEQRRTTTFNAFFNASRFGAVRGAFEAGKVDNVWSSFEANGKKWMVLSLELWPRPAAVAWARQVVASHPDHNVIISTHSYLSSGGAISTSNGGYGDTSPKYLWDQVVKQYPNVKIVLSGHEGQTFSRTDTGVKGNKIVTYLTTIHSARSNPIRILEIDTAKGSIKTWVFGPRGGTTYPTASGTQPGMSWVRPS